MELLVTLAMSALVMAAIFRLSMDQQKVHINQEQVAELQQNTRAALDLLVRDMRMAGYDPTRSAGAGCLAASATQFQFSTDLNEDGDCADLDENVTLSIAVDDAGVQHLMRKSSASGTALSVIAHLERIEFFYTLADGSRTTTPANPGDIRLVQVSLLVRSAVQEDGLIDQNHYTTASGAVWGPFNDRFRRRFMSSSAACRNMGLI